ncbi:type II toxin-antitoxin system prevent-host-death family antitoxin [Gordonia sp. JH63]|uniref:type II toxin-antitoxin system Phd/YefM family antitoxin n=1 Tax=Gordonia sp. JH63 TaxID=2698900 RepID=UPI00131F4FAD|nr:type II toxin-antitoxin system prevent-host-death family antitoxin [Gordonia sp. JH63]QHD84930.1 type II toxin-antitoxin system prevent-host-death family antitoxin [Gordonia sp. JH63]
MRTIGIRELRQHASQYLAQVEAGEELAITNRGRTVARLVPVSAGERSREALIEAGILVPARSAGGITGLHPETLPTRALTKVLDQVREDR